MKLRDRIIAANQAAKRSNTTNNTVESTPNNNKPTSSISRAPRRKSTATAAVAAKAIERLRQLKALDNTIVPPTSATSLKIRLRRDVAPVAPQSPNQSIDQSNIPTPTPRVLKKKATSGSPATTEELNEVAAILDSFIMDGIEGKKQKRAIKLSAPPSLMGIPTLAVLPQSVSDSVNSLPVNSVPYCSEFSYAPATSTTPSSAASSTPSSLSSSTNAGDLTCHSPPFSPCESSPSSNSPPSSPRESRPSSPHFMVMKDRIPELKEKGVKRKRTRTTQNQLSVLEAIFEEDKTPCKARRDEIGAQLSMTPRSVQVWFQNRRSKMKKISKAAEAGPSTKTTSSPSSTPSAHAATVPSTPPPVQEAAHKVLNTLQLLKMPPPALPVFTPLPSPLPLPQIQSVELAPPATNRPSLLRKPRHYRQHSSEDAPQPAQQQVFILPKVTIPIAPAPSAPQQQASASPARKSSKNSAKRIKLTESPAKTAEEIKPLEGVIMLTPASHTVQPTLAPRPRKVAMKSPMDFGRATLVPLSAN